jgi:hypothetical protein
MSAYKFFDKDSMFTFGEGDPQKKYSDDEKRPNVHLGQLKLLLSEMQLLVYHVDPARVSQVIYIGAANGHHIYVLSKLFPQFEYHLYDISDNWDSRLKGLANVKINNRYFVHKDIEKWKKNDQNTILISDVRNLSTGGDDKEKVEKLIQDDMEMQKTWVEQLEPVAALLKCRFPFCEKHNLEKFKGCKYNYLDGIIYRQAFPGYNSAETRLLVRGIAYRDWDFKIYEEQLFYHNSVVRSSFKFFNPITNDESPILKERGIGNDYDSTALTVIVMDYLKKTNVPVNYDYIIKTLYFILDNTYIRKKIDLNVERELSA